MEYTQALFFAWHDRIDDTPEFNTALTALCRDPQIDFKGHDEDSNKIIQNKDNCAVSGISPKAPIFFSISIMVFVAPA